jgi:endonuclease/exonuclease/phosphatase family metal-dependent hydrolase
MWFGALRSVPVQHDFRTALVKNRRQIGRATLGALMSLVAVATACRAQVRADGSFSIMTYNIKGAPWPITHGRGPNLRAIGERLRRLRNEGRQPQILVLQEAFSAEARAIGRRTGYRFVTAGPGVRDRSRIRQSDSDSTFLRGRRFWHGEGPRRLFGSGLLLLSDFPVRDVRRIAFPNFACAGFDCMANKGALMVTIDIPGAPSAIDVVTTHLNSRRAARVAEARSTYAYRRQVELLTQFIADNRNPDHPLFVAGDFNVGGFAERRAILESHLPGWAAGGVIVEALAKTSGESLARGEPMVCGAEAAIRRDTDFEFVAPGRLAAIELQGASVPFGREPSGAMLSDHIGYWIAYRLAPTSLPLAAFPRSARSAGDSGTLPR